MAVGAGKYDELCSYVRKKAKAKAGVILIVLEGDKGSGFSVQGTGLVLRHLPTLLRKLASDIESGDV